MGERRVKGTNRTEEEVRRSNTRQKTIVLQMYDISTTVLKTQIDKEWHFNEESRDNDAIKIR
uniref:Uncharacterized protein n=1 Tax=Cucumis melo TaxID=3656 RepID=A0A9I9D514_CUCME